MSLSGRVERSAWAKVQDVSTNAFLVHDLYKIMMKLVQSAFMPHLESEFTSCLWYCACAFCDTHTGTQTGRGVFNLTNLRDSC